MTQHDIFEIIRLVAVIGLVVLAAALATPKDKIPLAMRGILRILRKDGGANTPGSSLQPVPAWKRFLSFVIILIAAWLALI